MKHCGKKNKETEVLLFSDSSQLPTAWNDFVPEGHFLQSRQLCVTENSSLPDISFLYALVTINDIPMLAAGFQLLNLRAEHINSKIVAPWKYAAWQMFTTLARPRLLVGGHLFRHDVNSVFCNGRISAYDSYTYYKLAIEKAMAISRASAVLIKDMPQHLDKYFCNYEPQYLMLRNDISMEMELPVQWRNINDYEHALKHKYAQRYRKIRDRWHELDIRELNTREVVENGPALYELYRQVTNHQSVRIGFISPGFLPLLKQSDDRLKVWGIYEDGMLIGFFSAWVYDKAFDMFYIGFDYKKNKEYNLYFNILFFAVEQAIKLGKPKLILGRTALDAKARLGCKPRYLGTFLYIKNRFVRTRIMQMQRSAADNEGVWEDKHPFRKTN